MKIAKDGTASIWAVKVSSGGVKIDPEKIDDAKGYEKYEFEVKATGLAPDITEVGFEWNFGDNSESAKGKATVKVADREATTMLEHVYEPSPGLRKEDPPLKHLLEVKLVRDGKLLSSATAEVTVEKAEVVVTPRRLAGAPGGGFDFEAAAGPAGTYRFEWKWKEQSAPEQNEGVSSKASISLVNPGDHLITVELRNRKGELLAQDQVVASVDPDASPAQAPPSPQTGGGRWVLTRTWSASWKDTRIPDAKVNATAGNGSANINLSVPVSILQGGGYVTVFEPFSYSFSWTPLPTSIGMDERMETKMSIDAISLPTTGYNWSADIQLYNGWYEMNGEPPPEPGWVGHPRAPAASWDGVRLYSTEEPDSNPRTKLVKWAMREYGKPGEKEVDTVRVFGQGVNLRGATAVYLYHEYTWHE